jgi:nitrogen-specific signal transduction histidine kinase
MCLLRIYTNTQRAQGQYNYRCLLQNTVFFIKPLIPCRFFATSHSILSKSGAGLGLAISKKLCKLMGGDVSAVSKLGEGSEFKVILPKELITDNNGSLGNNTL